MDIRSLKYFQSVVKNKQFTLAAEELHISQPSLSNAIKALEREIGCKLFERSTKKLALTEPGQILYRHANKVLMQFDNIHKEMSDAKSIGAGNLSVGMIESYRYCIPKVISLFKQKYPQISIKVREMGPKDIAHALKNYDIHLGITSNIVQDKEFNAIPTFQDQYVLIAPVDHHFEHLSSVDISVLKNETFIHSLVGFEVRETIIKACHEAGFSPTVEYETESLETARSLVEIGLGVSVVPESFLELNPSKKVKIVYLENRLPKRTVYIVYQPQRYLSPAIHDFISIANQFSKEIGVSE